MLTPSHAGSLSYSLAEHLQDHPAAPTVDIIIQFRDLADLKSVDHQMGRRAAHAEVVGKLRMAAAQSQAGVQKILKKNGLNARELWIRNALAVSVPKTLLDTLIDQPEVERLELDAQVMAPTPILVDDPDTSPSWALDTIGAPEAWDAGYTGINTIVAIIDSGVDLQHPELTANWKGNPGGWYNPLAEECGSGTCSPCDANSSEPCDYLEEGLAHGTAVASLITGSGGGDSTSIGVAPEAKWIAAKIFGESIATQNSHISAALQWALDPTGNPDDVPDVVNNSWGFELNPDECLPLFQSEIQALQAAGIHVVFAAGNTGPSAYTSVSPGNLAEGLAVGSINSAQTISPSSARGPSACSGSIYSDIDSDVYPELVAPGYAVKVANMVDDYSLDPNSNYVIGAGTSFAAPHLSGALALLRSGSSLPRQTVEEALMTSTTDLGPEGPDNTFGRGLFNIPAAITNLSAPPTPKLFSPAEGATNVDPLTTFTWLQSPDPGGDPLTSTLVLSTDSSFTSPERFTIALAWSGGGILLAGLGVAFLPHRRRRLVLLPVLLSASWLLLSCGGDGSLGTTSTSVDPLEPNMTYTIDAGTPLQSGTTYFWKVEVSDPDGNVTESPVRSFTTR